jgi:D-alanyl-lipoteichoic acid acyltransferase DltB (MBOAT superfamily)
MKLMEARAGRTAFTVLLCGLIVAFCWLKHYAFFPQQSFLPFAYLTIGMSYVFFRMLHLIIDAHQGALPERVGVLSYVNYTLNFTSLVSGPIQFYADYRRSETIDPPLLTGTIAWEAIARIISGFFKVSIVSPVLSYAQAAFVSNIGTVHATDERAMLVALIMIVFPIYVYANFSGYMDVVVGVGRFLRLRLPENFNQPFISESFIDFWGRWHITLAMWVKTYIYSPSLLALMRRFPSRKVEPWLGVVAYFVAFFFVGVWHGQTSMFLFLGVLLGLGVSVNKLYQVAMSRKLGWPRYAALCANSTYAALSRGLTLSWFGICALWFWSTWGQLAHFAFVLGMAGVPLALGMLFAGATILPLGLKAVENLRAVQTIRVPLPALARNLQTAWYTAMLVVTLSATLVLNAPAPHILYRGF